MLNPWMRLPRRREEERSSRRGAHGILFILCSSSCSMDLSLSLMIRFQLHVRLAFSWRYVTANGACDICSNVELYRSHSKHVQQSSFTTLLGMLQGWTKQSPNFIATQQD